MEMEYREGLIVLLRTRENDTVVAGCISLASGTPRFFTAHPRCQMALTIALDDTDQYVMDVFDQTVEECRAANQGFDLVYRFAERTLELPTDDITSNFPLVTATIWTLQSECVDPRLLADPAQTPEWLHESLPPLLDKANDTHLELMLMLEAQVQKRVLN